MSVEGTGRTLVLASLLEEAGGLGDHIAHLLPRSPLDSVQGLEGFSRLSEPCSVGRPHSEHTWGLNSWLLYPLENMALKALVPSLELSSVLALNPIGRTPPAPHGPLSVSMLRSKQWDPTFLRGSSG